VATKQSAAAPEQLLDALIKNTPQGRYGGYYGVKLEDPPVGRQILALGQDEQVRLIASLLPRLTDLDRRARAFRAKLTGIDKHNPPC
jgi:hypothetical protein